MINEKEMIVGIIEMTQAGSWRWLRRDALAHWSSNGVIREVAVHDFDILVIIGMVVGRNGGIIDSMDRGLDFMVGNKKICG